MKKGLSLNEIIANGTLILVLFSFYLNVTSTTIVIQSLIYWSFLAIAFFFLLANQTCSVRQFVSLILLGLTLVISYYMQDYFTQNLFMVFGYATSWVLLSIIFEYASKNDYFSEKHITLLTIFTIAFSLLLITQYEVRREDFDWGYSNNNYYALCALPIVLLAKNRWLKYGALAAVLAAVFMSHKRSGLIALFIGLAFVLFYLLRNNKKARPFTILLIIATVAIAFSYETIADKYEIVGLQRLSAGLDDSGSGRLDIYKNVFTLLKTRNLLETFLGAGYNGFIRTYGSDVSAHNDLLEIIVDYGLVGFGMCAYIIGSYVKSCIRHIKAESKYAVPCILALCITATLMTFSHMIIYPTYFFFLLIFWAYIESPKAMEGLK